MVAGKTNKAIQSMLLMLSNTEQLNSKQGECLIHFNAGKDLMALLLGLLTAHMISGKLHWAGTLHVMAKQ